MEMVKEYRVRENVRVKLYSNIDMYKRMFFMKLNRLYEEAEIERKNGTLLDFDIAMKELCMELGIRYESL